MATCKECLHLPVCKSADACDGIVPGCKHFKKERWGRWEEWWPPKHMIFTGDEMLYRCTLCDAKYPDVEGYRCCPYCGARMDLGDEKT